MDHPSPEDGAVARKPPPFIPLLLPIATPVVKAFRGRPISLVMMSMPKNHRPAVSFVQVGRAEWECIVETHEERELIAFRSFLPINVALRRLDAVAALAAHLNALRLIGHFAVEYATGTVSQVHAMRFADQEPSAETLNQMLDENLVGVESTSAHFAWLPSSTVLSRMCCISMARINETAPEPSTSGRRELAGEPVNLNLPPVTTTRCPLHQPRLP